MRFVPMRPEARETIGLITWDRILLLSNIVKAGQEADLTDNLILSPFSSDFVTRDDFDGYP
jgi:hypothetical protein